MMYPLLFIVVVVGHSLAAEQETLCSKDIEDLRQCNIETFGVRPDFEEVDGWKQFNIQCLIKHGCGKMAASLSARTHKTASKAIPRSAASSMLRCMRETTGVNPKREARKCAASSSGNVVAYHKAKSQYVRHRDAIYGFVRAMNRIGEIIEQCEYEKVAACVYKLTDVNVVTMHVSGEVPAKTKLACKCFTAVPTGECKEAVITRRHNECTCAEKTWKEHKATAVSCGKKNGLSESEVKKYIKAVVADACYNDDELPYCA